MSNVMQFMSTTGIVILAFVLGVTVGRFGAYAMGMKFGMRYGMEMTMMNLYKIFKKQSIDTNLLEQISAILQHNFFQDYQL